MAHSFEAPTADRAWQDISRYFRTREEVCRQPGRGGFTNELLHVFISIEDSRQRWIPSRFPAMNPAFAIAEVVWILAGRNDSAFLNHWNPKLPAYAGNDESYHGAYGFRLRHHFLVDQLERAYLTLRSNPDSRQVVLQIWDAAVDLPDADGRPRAEDIPCNVCAFLKIRKGRLEWTQVLRSNDFFRGFPYNVVQFTSLQEILAGWLGVEPGPYYHFADSLHVYEIDHVCLDSHATVASRNADSLCLPKGQSDALFSELERRLAVMALSAVTRDDLGSLANFDDAPEAYQNLFRVVVADHARRRHWPDAAVAIMRTCTNPALIQAWRGWIKRFRMISDSMEPTDHTMELPHADRSKPPAR